MSAIRYRPPLTCVRHLFVWWMCVAGFGLYQCAHADTFDDFMAAAIDEEKWKLIGASAFTQSDGRLNFPCKGGATQRLVSTRTFAPGFFRLEFENYSSTNASPSGRGQGSYLALGLADGEERVRVIRGDVFSGGYFELNHFRNRAYNVWYHNTGATSGRLGLHYDGMSVRAYYTSELESERAWKSIGPAIVPNWSSPPKLYIAGSAGGSGCTTFAVRNVGFMPEPLPAALLEKLVR